MTARIGGNVDADDSRGGINEGGHVGGVDERIWWDGGRSVLRDGKYIELGNQGKGQATVSGHLER